jgi:hypothetical protein
MNELMILVIRGNEIYFTLIMIMMMIGFTQHRVRARGLELRGAKNLKTANRSGFSKKKK